MNVAALIAWLVTALGGFYLLGTWLARGGVRGPSRFPAPVIFGHFLLAAAGAPAAAGAAVPAERHLPAPVVLAHGALAATTLVLVLLAALAA